MAAQHEIAPLMTRIRDQSGGLDEGERERASALMSEIQAGLEEVMQRDDADRKVIEAMRSDNRQERSRLGQARQARHAYSPPGSSGTTANARFADRRG